MRKGNGLRRWARAAVRLPQGKALNPGAFPAGGGCTCCEVEQVLVHETKSRLRDT